MKPLCYAPWINLLRKNKNTYAPCCVSERQYFNSYDDYKNSDWLNNIKKNMVNNIWPSACDYCRIREEKNIQSDRGMYDEWFINCNKNIDEIDFPLYIDLRFSNTCNLKCRMCNPTSSNKIEQEYSLDKISYEKFYGKFKATEMADLINVKNKHIMVLKLLGGEPTIDVSLHKFLSSFLKNNTVEKMAFTTNATNLNKKFMNILSNANKISIAFSIDATGNTYEYIRTNSKWKKVEKNIYNILKEPDKFTYGFNVVLTPYIAFDINKLLDWFMSLHINGHKFWLNCDDSNVAYTSLSCLTKEHLSILKQSIYDWIERHPEKELRFIYDDMIKIVENVSYISENNKKFIQYNTYLDRIRGTNLLDLNSQFKDYIK